MTIGYRLLDNTQPDPAHPIITPYEEERYQFIKIAEEHGIVRLSIYDDGKGLATIGVGINLKGSSANNKAVSKVLLGQYYTDARANTINSIIQSNSVSNVQAALDAQMLSWSQTMTGLRTNYVFADENEVKQAFNIIATRYETDLDNKLPVSVPYSEERLTLFSLNYNTSAGASDLIGTSLKSDINNSNRAEAWYEIRYNSNGGDPNFYKGNAFRRYYEADRFDLYNDRANVSTAEAIEVAQMYTTHRLPGKNSVLVYENTYDPVANAQRWLDEIHVTTTIQDIYHELQPAISALKSEYKIASSISLEELQMATTTIVDLNGDGTQYDGSNNDQDFLIGSDVANVLNGGIGNDVLVGLKGDDTFTGGAGDDWFVYRTGDGLDTILDPEKGDRVQYNGVKLEGTAFSLDNGLYKFDGAALSGYALQKQGDDLFITAEGNSTGVLIKNFFPPNYNVKDTYTNVGITVKQEQNKSDNLGIPSDTSKTSPIVLDLNGDGLKFFAYTISANTYFDLDNDGYAEGTEWLDANDGFLVRDLNNNGKIDNQIEMFGDDSGTTAYYKLAQLDTNHDNKIDINDLGFSSLRIWQDGNGYTLNKGNGKTEAGELKTLASLGIESLSLQLTNDTRINGTGHVIAGTSSFKRTDGTTGFAADVLFDTHQTDSIYVGTDLSVSPSVDLSTLLLPLSRGYGTLPALHYAMTQDPTLKGMITALTTIQISTQMDEVYDKVTEIIYQWAGVTNTVPTTTPTSGSATDRNAMKLAVIQRFVDGDTSQINIDQAFGTFVNNMLVKLLVQGPLHPIFPLTYFDYDFNYVFLNQTRTQILEQAKNFAPQAADDKLAYWNEIYRILQFSIDSTNTYPIGGTLMRQEVEAAAGISLGYGAANVVGTSGNDILTGYRNTGFEGAAGNDTFNMGLGAYIIYNLGDGNDVYRFNQGVGVFDNTDRVNIYFGPSITYNSLTIQNSSQRFLIGLPDGGSLNFNNYNTIGKMMFADGVVKTYMDINYLIFAGNGSQYYDLLYGNASDNILNGYAGNDLLYGLAGNDTINGGDGDDIIYGDAGNDIIDGGVGNDTVDYSASTSGVTINLASSDPQFGGDADGDVLTNIENVYGTEYDDFFIGNASANRFDGGFGYNSMSYINSNTGVTVNLSLSYIAQVSAGYASGDILSNIKNLIGSNFDDTLTGSNYNSVTLNGGAGNDILKSLSGGDTLNGGVGSDLLDGGAGNDTLIYSDDLTWSGGYVAWNVGSPDAVINGEMITVTPRFGSWDAFDGGADYDKIVMGNGGEALFLDDRYSPNPWGYNTARIRNVEEIVGGTGNDIVDLTSQQFSYGNVVIRGGAGNDVLWSSAGNDTLYGDDGNDNLFGGTGNDTLYGGTGSDTLRSGGGSDMLTGGAGYDYYKTSIADATTTIINGVSTNASASGELQSAVTHDRLWFTRTGNDLDITTLGTTQHTLVKDWYAGSATSWQQLQEIVGADNVKIDSSLQSLVQAMATFGAVNPGFNPTSTTHNSLSDSSYFTGALATTYANAWHG